MTADEERRDAEARCCAVRHQFLIERIRALEESTDDRFDAEEKAMHQRWEQLHAAMEKVETLATSRSDQQNEWRQTVNDIIGTMLPRHEYNTAHQMLIDKTDALGRRLDRSEGSGQGVSTTVAWILAGVGGLVAIVTIILELTATR